MTVIVQWNCCVTVIVCVKELTVKKSCQGAVTVIVCVENYNKHRSFQEETYKKFQLDISQDISKSDTNQGKGRISSV